MTTPAAAAAALLLLLLLLPSGRGDETCGGAPAGGLPWDYSDTSSAWNSLSGSSCGPSAVQQSPVDLPAEGAADDCEPGSRRPKVRVNKPTWRARVANNGRTINVVFDCLRQPSSDRRCDQQPDGPITLRFSGDDGGTSDGAHETVEYDLSELHLHWCGDEAGSEHAIGGQRSAAEVHFKFKHWGHRGRPFQEALVEPGALHAVGILLDEGDQGDGPMAFPSSQIEGRIDKAQTFNDGFNIKDFEIEPLNKLLKKALKKVYKYIGSLTTPPCTLGLPWLVSAKRGTISSSFLGELRQLKDENGDAITRNYRPLQSLQAGKTPCLFMPN